MGRESIKEPNPIAMQSSIALLQERFRQLQRMKEKREKRELLRKLEEPKQYLPYHGPPSVTGTGGLLFFHFLPPRSRSSPRRQVPNISLWSGSESKCLASSSFGFMEAPLFASLPPTVTDTASFLKEFQDTDCDDDVDTSLHL